MTTEQKPGLLSLPVATQEEIRQTLQLDQLANHAGVTGLMYLRKIDERNYHRYFQLPENIEWPMIRSVSVSGLAQFRQPTGGELARKYLYCYDRNSSHPYAASQLKCGIGQPVARKGIEFNHLIPGFWAADVEGLDQIWQGLPLLPTHREWLPTPLLKMAAYQGCKINVHEAYIWPEKSDRAPVFARWAHNLWELRQRYEAGTPERQAIKDIMNKTIGLLRRKNGQGHRDYRPDWYSLILAEERAVVWYKAWQVAHHSEGDDEDDNEPIGAYHDALYYCSDGPICALEYLKNGDLAVNSLGGYKVEWRLPLVQAVKEILARKCSAADRIGFLKAWGRANGHIK